MGPMVCDTSRSSVTKRGVVGGTLPSWKRKYNEGQINQQTNEFIIKVATKGAFLSCCGGQAVTAVIQSNLLPKKWVDGPVFECPVTQIYSRSDACARVIPEIATSWNRYSKRFSSAGLYMGYLRLGIACMP